MPKDCKHETLHRETILGATDVYVCDECDDWFKTTLQPYSVEVKRGRTKGIDGPNDPDGDPDASR